jgi:ABC-type lipoprotein release transport system permease subunit
LVARYAAALLFGLEPRDPATFVTAIALLCTVGLLATLLPARRASKLDPYVALRDS